MAFLIAYTDEMEVSEEEGSGGKGRRERIEQESYDFRLCSYLHQSIVDIPQQN